MFRYNDDKKIRASYYGGSVGLVKPTNLNLGDLSIKEKLWFFDFNSLYPYILKNFEFPCGKVTHFIGDILNDWPSSSEEEKLPIGFFKVNIIAPDNLKVPVLQAKALIDGKYITIAPTGTFTGWYFSEELYNAKDNFGYEFQILEGYVFSERKKLFSEYMDCLYKLRTSFSKLDIRNYIAKILLNSFYGRWGMVPYFGTTKVMSDKELEKFLNRGDIENLNSTISFNNGLNLVILDPDMEAIEKDNPSNYASVSIAIASATTAYARIVLSKFKNHPQFDLYYFDTDSIVINISPEELNSIFPNIIGEDIGQLKLEHVVNKAVFLSPKCY